MLTRFICALALLGVSVSAQSNSPNVNMNHICALVQDGVAVASDNACDNYFTCYKGVASLQVCQSNYYFDKDTQSCLPQDEVNCLVHQQDPCSGATVGEWVPIEGSCTEYYYCGINGGTKGTCPTGENFDASSQTCKYAYELPCVGTNLNHQNNGTSQQVDSSESAEVNLCNYIQNGLYFGSASSCDGWNVCQNNNMQTGSCPAGFDYNVQINKCDYPADVTCNQVTNDPQLVGASTYGGTCTKKGSIKAGSTCAGYYLCDGSYFMLTQCINGLYYDTVSQTCVNRLDARNNCDRCAGTSDHFVNKYSTTNCNGYLFCENGVEKGTGYCPAGSYFDEVAAACVLGTEPNYGCCNPSYFGAGLPTPSTTTINAAVNQGGVVITTSTTQGLVF